MNTFKPKRYSHLVSFFIITLITISVASCGGGGGGGGGSTTDTTPPSILSTTPHEGATNVARSTGISVAFSEAVDAATVNTSTIIVSGGGGIVSGSVSLTSDKKIAVFTPDSALSSGDSITVTMKSTVADVNGNELGTDKNFSFATGAVSDTVPPTVTVSPVNDATGVSVSGNIVLTFSESMNALTLDSTTIKLFKGASEVSAAISYNSATFEVTINPAVDLDYETDYTVKVYTGAKDASNVDLESEFTSTFTTQANTTPPSVVSHVPVTNATSVAKGTNITLTFNKRLDPASVTTSTVTVKRQSDSSTVAGNVTYDDTTKTVTFDPSTDLEVGPTIYIVTATTGIKDLSGRAMTANATWKFTTTDGTAPAVSSYSPANGSTGCSVDSTYTVTFSEDISENVLMDEVELVDSNGMGIDATYEYDPGTKTLKITPEYNLNYEAVYKIQVGAGLHDASDNYISSATEGSFTTKNRKLTIMYYGDADNDLESYILNDISEMKSGYVDDQGVDLILIVDRITGYSTNSIILNEDYTDTRMFRISNGKAEQIEGGANFPEITYASNYEANMGDANTLKKFIKSCKAQYPAGKYALILSNHGGGARSAKAYSHSVSGKASLLPQKTSGAVTKEICYDTTSTNDYLYTAEISDVLTSSESVDLFGLDACLMSSVEFAYQYRTGNGGFSANIMVASAPLETGYGWQYTNILKRLKSGGGNNGTADSTAGGYELYYDPATITAKQLGAIIVEEQRDSTVSDSSQSLTCLDLSKVAAVKTAVDNLAIQLASESEKSDLESLRGNAMTANLLHYFDETDVNDWAYTPFFDLYNLASAVYNSASFSSTIQNYALAVRSAADDMVLYSFANSDFAGFAAGKSGVHIFFPDGDYQVYVSSLGENVNLWWWQDWYNAIDISGEYSGAPLGKLAWCKDSATASNSIVENWFELLDKWYDTQTIGSLSNFNYYSY